eukprot:13882945-Alexandrium_andersonii.AAC.1
MQFSSRHAGDGRSGRPVKHTRGTLACQAHSWASKQLVANACKNHIDQDIMHGNLFQTTCNGALTNSTGGL